MPDGPLRPPPLPISGHHASGYPSADVALCLREFKAASHEGPPLERSIHPPIEGSWKASLGRRGTLLLSWFSQLL